MCTSCTWRIHFFLVPAGVTKEPAQMQNEKKKNGRGISEVLRQSWGCVTLPVLQGDQAWSHSSLSLGKAPRQDSWEPCSSLGRIKESFLSCASLPFSPFFLCRLPFLPSFLGDLSTPLSFLFLLSLLLVSFLPQLYTIISISFLLSSPISRIPGWGLPALCADPAAVPRVAPVQGRRWVRF